MMSGLGVEYSHFHRKGCWEILGFSNRFVIVCLFLRQDSSPSFPQELFDEVQCRCRCRCRCFRMMVITSSIQNLRSHVCMSPVNADQFERDESPQGHPPKLSEQVNIGKILPFLTFL